MYRTTQNFKNSIYAPVRRTAGRVTFDISDVTASGDVTNITTSLESPLSIKAQLIDKGRSMTYKAATLEKDRFRLDGSFSFADDVITNNEEVGWSSTIICDASGNFSQITENFAGKVSGSNVENPHIAYRGTFGSLLTPSQFSNGNLTQLDTSSYGTISVLDGNVRASGGNSTTNGNIGQMPFSLNLIEAIKRGFGMVVDVPWIKTNVTKVTCNWHGLGSGPNGNKASFAVWNGSWASALTHTSSSVSKLTQGFTNLNSPMTSNTDGIFHFIAYTDASNGVIASTINTDYIEFIIEIAPLTLSFDFGSNHSSAGLTITFDQVNGEYATDFDMTAYDAGGAVIATTSVTGNTDIIAVPIGQLYNYRKVSVTIKKWSKPFRRARVFEVDFGFVKQYTDDNLINLSLVEEMDLLTGKLPSAEFKFTIDNSDRLFNILNPTGFYKYLQQRQQVIGEIGLDTGGGNFEYIPIGNYLLQEWQSDEGSLTATFTARTNLDSMASFDIDARTTALNQPLYTLAVNTFGAAGINNYWIDPALQSIYSDSLREKTNARDFLQMIAIAGGANIYVTRDGKINLKCSPATMPAPVDSADFDNMYNEPQIALDKAIKRVEVTYWTNLSTSGVIGVNHPVNTVGDTLKLEKNTLINTSARAQAVANWLMAQLAYRATYSVRWRGNPALELNDVLSMENTYGSTMNAYVTKNEIEYAGYLTVKTQAKGGVN